MGNECGGRPSMPTYSFSTNYLRKMVNHIEDKQAKEIFLQSIPITSNYVITKVGKKYIIEVFPDSEFKNVMTIEQHIKLSNLSDKCKLNLTAYAYDILKMHTL